jgi:cytochrome c-type biogenesis protein CcmH/NrfG
LQRVLQLNPEHAAAKWYLAQAYHAQGDLAESQRLLTTLIDQRDPQYGKSAAALLKRIASNK